MDEKDIELRCLWCRWRGKMEELDMDKKDEPMYCPECGASQFDIKISRKEKQK